MSRRLAAEKYLFPLKNSLIKTEFLPTHRLRLIRSETPVEEFPSIFADAPKIFLKRDDQLEQYGSGNKLRKLEFLFADLLSRRQCEHVITAGSLHSNHCKAVAVLAAKFGLQSHIFLRTDREENDKELLQGNALLDHLMGAKIYLIPRRSTIREHIEPRVKILEEKLGGNERAYSIALGGSDRIGVFGYVDCFIREILPLIERFQLGHLVVPCGSGGTMEGLALGNRLTGSRLRLHAFAVSDNRTYFQNHFEEILRQLHLENLLDELKENRLVDICDAYVGRGYGRMTDEQIAFLRRTISRTGVVFDPVYSGKCLWALAEELRRKSDRFADGEKNILFLHTGGLFGLMDPTYGEQWLKTSVDSLENWQTM